VRSHSTENRSREIAIQGSCGIRFSAEGMCVLKAQSRISPLSELCSSFARHRSARPVSRVCVERDGRGTPIVLVLRGPTTNDGAVFRASVDSFHCCYRRSREWGVPEPRNRPAAGLVRPREGDRRRRRLSAEIRRGEPPRDGDRSLTLRPPRTAGKENARLGLLHEARATFDSSVPRSLSLASHSPSGIPANVPGETTPGADQLGPKLRARAL
jgi:hypothetical protein